MWQLAPELGAAIENLSRVVNECTILSPSIREAARMRIAKLNHCIPCSMARMDQMESFGMSEAFYNDVDDPTKRGNYSELEQLAIGFAERFVAGEDSFDDEFWVSLRAGFSDREIAALTASSAEWLGLGRMNAVLGLEVTCSVTIPAAGDTWSDPLVTA